MQCRSAVGVDSGLTRDLTFREFLPLVFFYNMYILRTGFCSSGVIIWQLIMLLIN